MVRTEDAVIARFEHSGEKFEILVDPHIAMDMKHGKAVDFEELMLIDTVFKDARKGEEKGPDSLKKVFGTADVKEVVSRIIKEGELQLTVQQRRDIAERKKREIVAFIARNAMNPQTSAPHPVQRIETALEEIRFSVDINKPVSVQVQEALKELRKLLPISLDKLNIAVRIPAQFTGKASVVLHKYGVQKEEWQNDGSLVALLEIPAGVKQDLFGELNHLTHGEVESKILEKR
ncbi:MAG: ribosome assembly factor SBDS [Candidatus Diapherotrites archaeon]|uniref:Ribosome assembly factor SBDS n=1 Tax=Candidatus Iainarchaeum sp. TaxID=3101447 RepID=A0A8T3YLV4_9ARCH|nr:ribosome assembly factor SBDS [Candidatus Diapherotrites archaeon]